MSLFQSDNGTQSPRHRAIYAAFEIAYTLVDFGAAVMFIIGSVMFFSEQWQTAGTWMFLIGSILFASKPTLRLIREVRLVLLGDTEDVANKLDS